MEEKSIKKNYLYLLLFELTRIIIPVITTPYLARVLGAENIGIYGFTLSISTYFILFGSLGTNLYGKREIAYVQDDTYNRSKIFYEVFIIKCISLLISSLLFYFIFCIKGEYTFYFKILLLEILANIIDISWFYQGIEEFKKYVFRSILVKLIIALSIFIFIKSKDDLSTYFIIYVISLLLSNLTLWFYLPQYICKVSIKKINIQKHIKDCLILLIPQLVVQIYLTLDKTMLGYMLSDKSEVAYYEQSLKIVRILLTLITSIAIVLSPRISSIYSKQDNNKIKVYIENALSYTLMMSIPLMFGLFVVTDTFVPIYYGVGYNKLNIILKIFSLMTVIIAISHLIGNIYLIPTKKQNKYTISVLSGAIIDILLNVLLIRKYASIGASIATVISELVVTCVQIYYLNKELNINVKKILIEVLKYLIASIIMFIVCYLIKSLILNNYISFIIQLLISILIYFSLLLLMKSRLIKLIQNKLIVLSKTKTWLKKINKF